MINDNGGTKTAADFSFKVNGGTATPFEADGQNDLTVDAGTYSVTEPAAAGYTTSYDNCDDLALANGETKTCTITNNDQPAKLIVKKIVINDNGGTKTAADFSFKVNGGTATAVRGRRPERPHRQRRHLLGHRARAAGYTTSYDNCSELVLANGATATCTITNDDQPAKLIVRKIVINDNGGTKTRSRLLVHGQRRHRDRLRGRRPERPDRQRGQLLGHRACSSRLHHELRQLQRAHARERCHRDLHDHQQRPAREADRQEDRDQRQRRHQDRRGLHARRQRGQRNPGVLRRQHATA